MTTRTRISNQARISLVCGLLLIFAGSTARADVISPPPDECPPGSQGQSCHGPPHCEPAGCSDDSDCDDGMRCQPLDLCIGQINCSGRLMIYVDTVLRVCEAGSSCTDGNCLTLQVCVEGGTVEEDASVGDDADISEDADATDDDGGVIVRTYGCGCQQVQPQHAAGALLFAVLPGLALIGMRRKRRR